MSRRAPFATSWWGTAWIEALERSAHLDPSRLSRGRTYARQGAVVEREIGPGWVRGRIAGSHGRWYAADVAVRKLAESEWDQVADAIAARAAHAAALLEGELDPGIVEDLEAVDVRLLPGPGDLRPDCTCPDWAEPCKHAAALCYLVATELDRDPFVLFQLRGIDRARLTEMIRARRGAPAERSAPAAGPPAGVVARDAWAARPWGAPLGELPDAVVARASHLAARAPGRVPPWDVALPPSAGTIDPRRVDALAQDAADRAWGVVADGATTGVALSRDADLARRAGVLDSVGLEALSRAAAVAVPELRAWSAAWRIAGPDGVRVLADHDSWSTDATQLDAGRDALVEAGHPRRTVSVGYDRLQVAGATIVLGPRRRWYRIVDPAARRTTGAGRRPPSTVRQLDGPPADDVVDLVGPPGDLRP